MVQSDTAEEVDASVHVLSRARAGRTSFNFRIEYVYTDPAKTTHANATNRLRRRTSGVTSR